MATSGVLPASAATISVAMIEWTLDDGMKIELGSGNYGRVFAAKYAGKNAAVKLVDVTGIGEGKFLREVNLHYSLQHENIVSVYGGCVDARPSRKTLYYIVMERMACTLREAVLDPTGNCHGATVLDRLRWLHQVIKALRFMHSHAILHGDLKPENIMLDTGSTEVTDTLISLPTPSSTAKITDFGCARVRRGLGSTVTATARGKQGTPLYMDPALWDDSSVATTQSDVYSIAIIAWELITGDLPFGDILMEAEHDTDFERMVRFRTAVTAFERRPSLDTLQAALVRGRVQESHVGAIIDLVERCWSARSMDRPSADHVEAVVAAALLDFRVFAQLEPRTPMPNAAAYCAASEGNTAATAIHEMVAVATGSAASSRAVTAPRSAVTNALEVQAHTEWSARGEYVNALTVLPDGRLASGGADRTVKVWNAHNGKCEFAGRGHTGPVTGLLVLPDLGLCSYSVDGTVKLWDISTGANVVIRSGLGRISSVVALPDGRFAACTAMLWSFGKEKASRITVWKGQEAACTYLTGHTNEVYRLVLLLDGRLASCSKDKTIKLWDLDASICVATLSGHATGVFRMIMLPDGRLATACGHILKVWNVQTLECEATVYTSRGELPILSMVAIPDGRVATGHVCGSITLCNISTGMGGAPIAAHGIWVKALAVLHDGRLVSGGDDGVIKVWSYEPRAHRYTRY